MSVKMMTTDQIHTNLATIYNMWPGGIPNEQIDQVNALKAELKRRGVDQKAVTVQAQATKSLTEMTADQLAKELQKLSESISKDPNNEELQEQFANVRYQLRNKLKNEQPTEVEAKQVEQTNGKNGHVAPNFGKGVPSDDDDEEQRQANARLVQAQQARVREMEAQVQLVRKHNLAKIAAEVASDQLKGKADPNGDDIANACDIGLQVAQTIFAKVEL